MDAEIPKEGFCGKTFQKNEMVTVAIEDIGSEGEGIGKAEGFTLFVKDGVLGDIVEARIVKCKKTYAYGRLEKVLKPSPFRVEPKCTFYRQCGGCQLQALSYEKQLSFKREKIRNSLIRIGGFSPAYVDQRLEDVVGMEPGEAGSAEKQKRAEEPESTAKHHFPLPETGSVTETEVFAEGESAAGRKSVTDGKSSLEGENASDETLRAGLFRYRNKALYPIGRDKNGNAVAGFYAGRTHTIIPNTNCWLGAEENEEILNCILNYMNDTGVTSYDEATGTGLVRHVLIRKGFSSGELMVCLVLNRKKEQEKKQNRMFLPKQDVLVSKLGRIKGMTSVSVSINNRQTNVIMGEEIHTIWGKETISDTIRMRDMNRAGYPRTGRGLTFRISPLSFYQVNPVQVEKLYSLALEYAGLTGRETVWDLYCGIGTISLFLAGSARKVWGVEVVPEAIRDARENAERNGIRNAEFFVGRAEDVLQGFYKDGCGTQSQERSGIPDPEMLHPDVIVVDPPRKGCDEACLETMLKMAPKRIVYVSCDPATLARDLRVLYDGGYELERVRGVDMFGMTVHVETVVLMSRVKD